MGKIFNDNFIFFFIFFLLLKSVICAEDNIVYLPGAECGVPGIREMEKNFKGIPSHVLSQSELRKRGRISMGGQVQYDTAGQIRGMWNIFQNSKWQQTSAVCRKVTSDIYVYVASDVWYDSALNPNGYVSQVDVDKISAKFSTDNPNIYSRTRNVFGEEQEKGIDSDSHITLFLLDIDNDLALENAWINKTWVGGYSTRMDNYPDGTNNMHSNERKIIYLDTYPTFEHGKVYYESSKVKLKDSKPTVDHNNDDPGIYFPEGSESIYSILAHEFQHKIHGFYDPDEELWLEEGCSELAGVINELSNKSMWPQKSHLKAFFENSNDNLLIWKDNVKDYGVSLMFFTYLYDHFSGDAFINSLVKNKEKGVISINDNLIDYGFTETFEEIFNKWAIANYFNDSTSFSGEYGYRSIDLFDTLIFKTTPKEPSIYKYGMNPIIRYKLEAPLGTVERSVEGHAAVYFSFVPAYNTSKVNFYFSTKETIYNIDVRLGIKKTDDTFQLKFFPISNKNTGELTVTDFNSTDVKEAVLIVINQSDESKKISFSALVASGDNPFPPADFNALGGRGRAELTWEENKESLFTKTDYESTFVNDSTFMVRYFTGYNVYRSLSIKAGYSRVNTSFLTQSSYVDEKVRGNIQYFYCVTANMAKFVIKNGNIIKSEPVESFFSLPASAYVASTGKIRSRCFISNVINDKKIIENILRFRDKYLFNDYAGFKIADWYYR